MTETKKHAYLIMAHNNFDQLHILLKLIDDSRNDIFIHIDKKNEFSQEDKENLIRNIQFSKIEFIERKSVVWGACSQIEVSLMLLKQASSNHYMYYHLLSGMDLPIHTQDEIHDFFDQNKGKEFINFCDEEFCLSNQNRVKYYYMFQDKTGRSKKAYFQFLILLQKILVGMQKIIGVNRIKEKQVYVGSNWYSITDEFCQYAVGHYDKILKAYEKTYCSDEVYMQTLVKNSPFKKNIYSETPNSVTANMRLIDWKRGNSEGSPYVWRLEDFDELINSDCLFARKFDEKEDKEIIYKIYQYLRR